MGAVRYPVDPPVLIFDGDCAFCSSCVRFLERRIRLHPACEPWQRLDLGAYGVTQSECESAVQFVDADGSVHAADKGIARLLIRAGRGWAIVGRLMLMPGPRHASAVVYRWIARHRHRMPGGTAHCSLPSDQRSVSDARDDESGSVAMAQSQVSST